MLEPDCRSYELKMVIMWVLHTTDRCRATCKATHLRTTHARSTWLGAFTTPPLPAVHERLHEGGNLPVVRHYRVDGPCNETKRTNPIPNQSNTTNGPMKHQYSGLRRSPRTMDRSPTGRSPTARGPKVQAGRTTVVCSTVECCCSCKTMNPKECVRWGYQYR